MTVRTNGGSRTEQEGRLAVHNVGVRIFTAHRRIGDTPAEVEEEEARETNKTKIAIPCIGQADLNAPVSAHFGRCDSYVIVSLEDEKIKTVEPLSNTTHTECSSSVRMLAENGVKLILVTAMGMRPYLACRQMGIEVRHGITGTVADAIQLYMIGKTLPMTEETSCEHHLDQTTE